MDEIQNESRCNLACFFSWTLNYITQMILSRSVQQLLRNACTNRYFVLISKSSFLWSTAPYLGVGTHIGFAFKVFVFRISDFLMTPVVGCCAQVEGARLAKELPSLCGSSDKLNLLFRVATRLADTARCYLPRCYRWRPRGTDGSQPLWCQSKSLVGLSEWLDGHVTVSRGPCSHRY